MSKRFTDSKKWRNEWFRTLSTQAKLAWVYLCDECESHGIFKMDFGLAKFQTGLPITKANLIKWLKDKIFFLDEETVVLLKFYSFQYGDSKDTWSAKIRAKEKLEALGFIIENNDLLLPKEIVDLELNPQFYDFDTTVVDCGTTCLIRGRGRVKGRVTSSLRKGGAGGKTKLPKNEAISDPVFWLHTFDEIIENVEEATLKKWSDRYPDHVWMKNEIEDALFWNKNSGRGYERTKGGWSIFISGWLKRADKPKTQNTPKTFEDIKAEKSMDAYHEYLSEI